MNLFSDISDWLHERAISNAYQQGLVDGDEAFDNAEVNEAYNDGYEDGYTGVDSRG
jgi:hypothetical protein